MAHRRTAAQDVPGRLMGVPRRRVLLLICLTLLILLTSGSIYVQHREAIYQTQKTALFASYCAGHHAETLARAQQMLRDSGGGFDTFLDNYAEVRSKNSNTLTLPAADHRAYARFLWAATLYQEKRYPEAKAVLQQIQMGFGVREKSRLLGRALDWNQTLPVPLEEYWFRHLMPYKG